MSVLMPPNVRLDVPHVVYYAWDGDDWLLYVGCTSDLPGRMRYHAANSIWRKHCARVSWSQSMAAREAFAFETDEIQRLAPIFNVRDNPIKQLEDDWWDGLYAERQRGMFYPCLGDHIEDYERRVPRPVHCLEPDALAEWLQPLAAQQALRLPVAS